MRTIEVTAKSLAEATTNAAEKLGVDPSALTVTVLEETKGLFGKASIRVRADVLKLQEAKAEAVVEAPAEPKRKPAARKPAAVKEAAPVATVEVAPVAAPKAKAPPKSRAKAPVEAPKEAEGDEAPREVLATQEDADNLEVLVRNLIEASGLEVNVAQGEISGKYVSITLDGTDAGYLVGKHGEVLNALQYLTNIMANQKYGNGIRVTLDGNAFRKNREEQLEKLAKKIAEQVLERSAEALLDPLPAFERRIIHKVLSEYPGIQTFSEGEDPNRRVVIAPAD